MYGFFILVIWIPAQITCIIVPCYRIHVIWLFPVTDMDIPVTGHRAVDTRYVESHIYCSRFLLYCSRYIVPVSRYIVLCYQQSSGPVIMLPVSCICSCDIVYLTYQIIKLTWVWGRLDGWLDHIGWMSGSIVCPTAGDGVVLATVCYSWASRYCFSSLRFPLHVTALAGWPWSQQPGVCLRPLSRVCTGYTHPIRTPRPWVSN